jgi:elastase-2
MLNPLILLVVCAFVCDARPSSGRLFYRPVSFQDVDAFVLGGQDALPGAWPWQLSLEGLASSVWVHICGASLLSGKYALTAAQCVDGYSASNLRILAGLHNRIFTTGSQTRTLISYTKHSGYANGAAEFANDIAVMWYNTPAILPSDTIAYATLPANNNNDFAGTICVVTGWGRTSSSNTMPSILQQGQTTVLTLAQCRQDLITITTGIWSSHICVKHSSLSVTICSGDGGGPMNCQSGPRYVVAGISSFGIVNQLDQCLPSYPAVFTRVSSYLSWIQSNTP